MPGRTRPFGAGQTSPTIVSLRRPFGSLTSRADDKGRTHGVVGESEAVVRAWLEQMLADRHAAATTGKGAAEHHWRNAMSWDDACRRAAVVVPPGPHDGHYEQDCACDGCTAPCTCHDTAEEHGHAVGHAYRLMYHGS